ncbi:MAG: ExbD/TolR family protein [Planctomycetota bacterium]|jgi:biopolymer transport protein ExbD
MSLRTINRSGTYDKSTSFNITPIIDIVFLLIIFFLVVCQFIEAENFPVNVPDDCEFAASVPEPGTGLTTVTVMKTADGGSDFAVGSEKIITTDYTDMVEDIARLINIRLKDLPSNRRVVTLRIDKDTCFADAQYALAGIAESSATDIQLAVLKQKHTNPQ